MYISDHRPALLGTVASLGVATMHYLTPAEAHPMLEMLKFYMSIVGQIAGALAGFGSFGWYLYSWLKARKQK